MLKRGVVPAAQSVFFQERVCRSFFLGISLKLGFPPAQDASHHQDNYIFSSRGPSGDPNLNLHLPRLHPGRGGQTTQL